MKATVMSVLLCLFSALVEAHSQTVPYVSFMGANLPNHSYVDLTLVGNGSDSVQCHTDLVTCCSGAQGAHRGDWYFPNGERLMFSDSPGNIYESCGAQRVDLRRKNNGDTSGIYRCTIETNAVHSNNDSKTRETVYAGLYTSRGECTHMCCSRLSTFYPPEAFSLVLHVCTDSCVSTTRVEHKVRGEGQSKQIKYKDLNQR